MSLFCRFVRKTNQGGSCELSTNVDLTLVLHRFLYLEEVALSDYVSAAEDGLRVKSARTAVKGGTTGLEADAKFLKAQGG